MNSIRNPILDTVALKDLRPTQMTVGLREVKSKRQRWQDNTETQGAKYLGRHTMPVVVGPKGRRYILDHHHLARALYDEGVKEVLVTVVANLKRLEKDEFWTFLDNRGWVHLFDAEGKRCGADDLPKSVADLADDPFRSLAGELRRVGGFAKDTVPFTEFLWADYLRRRIKRKLVDDDFSAAMERALELAKAREANHLPGWCGPVTDET